MESAARKVMELRDVLPAGLLPPEVHAALPDPQEDLMDSEPAGRVSYLVMLMVTILCV